MKLKTTLLIAGASVLMAGNALAQSSNRTVVREPVPTESTVIIANSAEDLALQEEIRKIRVHNAYIDGKVGVQDGQVRPITNEGQDIVLYGRSVNYAPLPQTKITYSSANNPNTIFSVTPTTTIAASASPLHTTRIVERNPLSGSTLIHTVAKGDTLYSLARQQCVTVGEIQSENTLASSIIQLGQVITLPASRCGATQISASTQSIISGNASARQVEPVPIRTDLSQRDFTYAVLPKDTLYSIGQRHCATPAEIASASGIPVDTNIQPGQVLTLPQKSCLD